MTAKRKPKDNFFDNWGYGLIGAFALVYGGQAVRLPSFSAFIYQG